jgi:uncharacterized membrane protein YphA (DoxX/SURF4 family)
VTAPTAADERRTSSVFDRVGEVGFLAPLRVALGVVTLLHLEPFLRDAAAGRDYDDRFWSPFPLVPHVPGELWRIALWVGAGAALLLAVGLCTRVANVVVFVVVAGNLLVSQTHVHNNRAFLAILLGGLALLPSGGAGSVDAWRRRRRGERSRTTGLVWPLLLLRVQVSLVYAASGVSKLIDPDWVSGVVLWDRVVRHRHVLDPTPMPAWAIDVLTSRWLYWVVAPGAVLTELFIAVGLWSSRTRLAAVWSAIVFHVAIEVSAEVEIFSVAAIAALAIWVTPSCRDRVLVVASPAAARVVRALDWFGRFRVEVAPACQRGLVALDRDGTGLDGRPALALLLSRLPLSFLVAAPARRWR